MRGGDVMSCSRRQFLSVAALTAAPVLAGETTAASAPQKRVVRFCLFADLHYGPGIFPNDTPEFLEKILRRAEDSRVDFVLHLGDLTHAPKRYRSFVDLYNDFRLPTYHTLGNHDTEANSYEETLDAYRMTCGHYYFDVNGFRFVIADNNYTRFGDGRTEHYSNCNGWRRPDAQNGWMPEEQVEWLRTALETSPHPCVICSHYSFERECDGVPNYSSVREVIREANGRHPGRVRLVLNGHHHVDNLRIIDNVLYYDVNSANYQYYRRTHAAYPEAYMNAHSQAAHCLAWGEPLSAIVTLSADGRVRIEGSRAKWLFGVSPEKAGLPPCEETGVRRLTAPVVQSVDLTFGARA